MEIKYKDAENGIAEINILHVRFMLSWPLNRMDIIFIAARFFHAAIGMIQCAKGEMF